MYKKISVITPSLNQGNFIEKTIRSVIDQGYPNLEFIIIDGGSTDNTIDIIKKYESHITYWVSEPDNGQSHAINKGLKIATGDIVNWLNSDDFYEPNALYKVNEAFQDNNINVFCAKSYHLEIDGSRNISSGTDIYTSLEKMIAWAKVDQPETFYRKSSIDAIGNLNDNIHYIMDRDLWIRYILMFGTENILVSDEIVVNFRKHADSKTVSASNLFESERNYYFFLLSTKCHSSICGLLKDHCERLHSFTIEYTLGSKLLYHVVQYFIYLLIQEYYAKARWNDAKNLIAAIDKNVLGTEEIHELNNLSLKMKYIPKSFFKAYKRNVSAKSFLF